MRKLLLLSILSVVILFAGCSSAGSLTETQSKDNNRPKGSISDDMNYYQNLADYLRRVPGLTVSGSGNNVLVTVRGVSSINSGITPLYVIDGNAIGHSYSQANSTLNPRNIDYVQVLKGSDAGMYGVRGGNGVIIIATRK